MTVGEQHEFLCQHFYREIINLSVQIYSPSLRLIQQLAGNADQHAVSKGRLETRLGELVEHLGHSKAIVLPQMVQQAEGVVLEERTCRTLEN